MLSAITPVNISSIDLNLLVVLHAVLETESVTLAAKRLHVTQSAVSNALARLRDLFHDPLVVRHSRGVTPTSRARALAPQLAALVRDVGGMLGGERFDAATTTREFTLACADYYGVVLLPRLIDRLRDQAPHATLRLVPLEALSTAGGLAHDIDVHVGMPHRVPPACLAQPMFDDRFVCLSRRAGRRSRGRFTVAEYVKAAHVRVQVLDNARDPIDLALAKLGHARTIALTVPHFSVVPLVVAETGLVATLSRRLAETYAPLLDLELRDPPVDLSRRAVQMIWHRRSDADEGARWFRRLVSDVAG